MAIRLGIIGTGYGAAVLLPAFRATERFEIVAMVGRNGIQAEMIAAKCGIAKAFDDADRMLDWGRLDAVAVAVPPHGQERIVLSAIGRGLHVFAEKPLALTVEGARRMRASAVAAEVANLVDFNFREIAAFGVARDMIRVGAIGVLRHVVVTWQLESYANRMRLSNWKADQQSGGGSLFNFVSHSLDYLECLVGPIEGLSARLAGLPGDARPNDAFVAITFAISGGVAGNLTMSAAAYKGSGHRIEIYGEDGALVLENTGSDYMRGFRLLHAVRPGDLKQVDVASDDPDPWSDGRILPVSRLAHRFADWIELGREAESDFAVGLRVQVLLEAANLAHRTGRWVPCPRSEPGPIGLASAFDTET